jgi:methyltransferase
MDGRTWLWLVVAVVIVQRIAELRLARRNGAWLRAQGAVEVGARHYPVFFVLHPAWLVGTIVEASVRGPTLVPAWLVLFAAAQGLRYWAIGTLGPRWNTRILVLPGRVPIRAGPYRWLRHPNYVAVAIELLAVPAAFGAWGTAIAASLANAIVLLAIRIPAENRALTQLPAPEHDLRADTVDEP